MRKLNLDSLNFATSLTNDFIENCKKVVEDKSKEQRLKQQKCRYCFYNSRLAGQAITEYECRICSKPGTWANLNNDGFEHNECAADQEELKDFARELIEGGKR